MLSRGGICVQPRCHVSMAAAPIDEQNFSLCPNKAMETATDTQPLRLHGPRPITGHCYVSVNWSLSVPTEE